MIYGDINSNFPIVLHSNRKAITMPKACKAAREAAKRFRINGKFTGINSIIDEEKLVVIAVKDTQTVAKSPEWIQLAEAVDSNKESVSNSNQVFETKSSDGDAYLGNTKRENAKHKPTHDPESPKSILLILIALFFITMNYYPAMSKRN